MRLLPVLIALGLAAPMATHEPSSDMVDLDASINEPADSGDEGVSAENELYAIYMQAVTEAMQEARRRLASGMPRELVLRDLGRELRRLQSILGDDK